MTETLTKLWGQFVEVIPNFVGALTIFIIGFIIAKIASRVVTKLLEKIQINKFGDKLAEIDIFQKANLKINLAKIFGKIIYYFLLLFFMVAATDVLNMPAISNLVTGMFNLIPKLIVGFIILIFGILLADGIRGIVQTTLTSLGLPSAKNNVASTSFEIIDGETVGLTITLDNYGEDNTWEITNASGIVVASGGPYANFNLGQENEVDVCLVEGCYDFTMYDAFGDGMCCQYGFGGFEIVLPDGTVALSGGTFETSETGNFCLNTNGSGQAPVSNFTANQTTTCEGTNVNFTDQSNFSPETWNWTFDGGTPSSSTQENPSNITYSNPGTYSVSLEVSNANGTNTETKTGYITVTQQPTLSGAVVHESCFGSSDGSIDLQIQNWTPGMTYSWTNGFNGADPSGLSALGKVKFSTRSCRT